jgi:hypothetical protein
MERNASVKRECLPLSLSEQLHFAHVSDVPEAFLISLCACISVIAVVEVFSLQTRQGFGKLPCSHRASSSEASAFAC